MAAIYIGTVPLVNLDNFVVRYPGVDIEAHPQRVFRTAYGEKRTYSLGVRLRRYPCELMFTSNAQYAAFLALFRSCMQGTNAFLWSRDGTGTDAVTVGFADQELQHEIPYPGIHEVSVILEEPPYP